MPLVVIALAVNIPQRIGQYRVGLIATRQDGTEPARRLGVRNALILVRESWGAQLVPRLWALGISRSLTEVAYRSVDTCVLDRAISSLERSGARGASATRVVTRLFGDSARLTSSTWSPDPSERVLPGRAYDALCRQRIDEDRAGFTIFAPLLARDWGDNVYARDLHARDSLLIQAYPHRTVYLLRSDGYALGARLVLVPLPRDSLVSAWANE